MISHGQIEVKHFGEEYHRNDLCPFSTLYQEVPDVMGFVNLDYLVKVICLASPVELLFSSFIINKYFVESYFKTKQIHCFSAYFCPQALTSIDDFCLHQLITVVFAKYDYLFSSLLLYLLIGTLLKGKDVSFSSLTSYFFIQYELFIVLHGL